MPRVSEAELRRTVGGGIAPPPTVGGLLVNDYFL